VVYLTSDHHIEELWSTDGHNWHAADLSGRLNGPDAAGNPAAYVRTDNVNSVLYRDYNGNIQELYLLPWGSSWQIANLSALAHAPRARGNPAPYIRSDNVNAIVYRGYDDVDIHELYLADSGWKTEDLSLRTGAPQALGDPAGYVRSDGVNSIVYRALEPTGHTHIQEIYGILPPSPPPRLPASPLDLNWATADLSYQTGGPDASEDPAPYILSPDGISLSQANAVVYRDVSGNVQELYLPWGGGYWVGYNLNLQVGAPQAIQ
jgi:hypothetical protein